MRVLIGCEFSGRVRDAFTALGHDAWSCDLEPSETSGKHIQDDILKHLNDGWDLAIMHPPCTDLAVSGARHFAVKRADGRQQKSIRFFMRLAEAPISKICVENPVGIMSTLWRKPDQIIQPWQFGDPFTKTTCLWLKGLPLLVATKIVDRGEVSVAKSGNRRPTWMYAEMRPGLRQKVRNRTFQGVADAMALQWSGPK